MNKDRRHGDGLEFGPLPSLPYETGEELPEEGYLVIRIEEDGRLQLQGTRHALRTFFEICARAGLVIEVGRISWCG
jgi:hypothetical protein